MEQSRKEPSAVDLAKLRIRSSSQEPKAVVEHINGVPFVTSVIPGVWVDDNKPRPKADPRGGVNDMSAYRVKLTWAKLELVKLLIEGSNIKEASQALGVSGNTCRAYLRDPEVLRVLKELSETKYREVIEFAGERQISLRDRTLQLANDALDEMERLLAESNDGVKFKVAQDILDRSPDVPRNSKTIGEHKHIHVDVDTLMLAAKAASELGTKHTPRLIEAEKFDPSDDEPERR